MVPFGMVQKIDLYELSHESCTFMVLFDNKKNKNSSESIQISLVNMPLDLDHHLLGFSLFFFSKGLSI